MVAMKRKPGRPRNRRRREWKRRPYKKRQQVRKLANIGRAIIPDQMGTILKYTDRITLTCTAGVAEIYEFKINSIYDPDLTGTGHQPVGRDEWMAFYSRYRVLSAKCKASFYSTEAVNNYMAEIACAFSTERYTANTDPELFAQNPYSRYKRMSLIFNSDKSYLQQQTSIGPLLGESKTSYKTDTSYHGTDSADPGVLAYWTVAVQPIDQATTSTYIIYVDIQQYVVFHKRKDLLES